jgi:hypothetical protein
LSESALLRAFDRQVEWCGGPSPFTARLLQRTRVWLEADAQAHAIFAAAASDPLAGAVALRWAGALHHLALRGQMPWAALWPPATAGGQASDEQLDGVVAAAWQSQRSHVQRALSLPPQTNEVQRSAVLLPGLLHVAAATGLPLVLLEVGASAGLNLWCDRYRYEYGAWSWGDPAAGPVLRSDWRGPVPAAAAAAAAALRIVRRAGCDAAPIDLSVPDESLRLASFIWPDQAERLVRLNAARERVPLWLQQEGVSIQAQPAARFVQQALASLQLGTATVLMHSVVWQYIASEEQAAVTAALQAASARATPKAPLAWLRMEPAAMSGATELRCRLWPGAEDRLLARAHPHGAQIDWLAA